MGGRQGGGTGSTGSGPGGSTPGANGDVPSGPCEVRLPARLILLSDYQHLNTLKALLGTTAVDANDAAENTQQTKPFTQKGVVVNSSLVHQRLSWAAGASESFAARFAELTGCTATKTDDACAGRFISSFAARAFRRPVANDEVNDVMAVYNVGKATSFTNGVKRAVEAILGSPSFMYRRELGAANDQGGLTLSPHELASEVSFLLSDAPPDAELQKAADSGALAKDDELARQVERLIAQREVQDALSSTLISSWGISNLFGTAKDPKLFPEYNPGLQAAMFHETELFVRNVLWDRKAPLPELLTSKKGFVNKALAAIYGVPFTGKADEYVEVALPGQRAGVLTQASVMATLARTDTTSVVARGLFVRGALLCLAKLPGPPETLSTQIQDLLKADMTERQRAEVRAGNGTCSGCHAGIDPFGLLLEQYDPLGKYRTTLKGMTIDPSSEVSAGSFSGPYSDAVAFATAAADSPEFSACVSRQFLAYATQDEDLKASDCQVSALGRGVDTLTMPELIKAVAASPALRLRNKEAP
jgi:Protein of unknown function (DUF1592)/Protein of unknown function (DUF1588)/Protein of unknown function (DUF1595)